MYIENFVRFWKFPAYGLTFGCTAWADAGAIAKIANQWSPQKRDETVNNASPPKWQDAMNYFMGSDSLNDDVKNNIGNALDNEQKIHEGNWIFPEAVVDIYCGDTHPDKKICKLRTNPNDPKGPEVTAFASSWVSRGHFWNTYNVVLCPRFFYEKDSLWGISKLMQIGQSDKSNASEYKMAWGHTIYHELMHLDPVIADKEVWDVAYGACNVARLAKKNGCTGDSKWPGWDPAHDKANSMNNADSFAFFASAAYFQDAFTLDKPGEAPDCDTSATDVADYTADVEGILYPPDDMVADLQNAQAPPDPSPDEIPAPDGPTPVYPIDPNSPPSGLATPFAGASAYFVSQPDASTTAAAAPTSGTPNSATASRSDGERFLHPATALVPPAS